MLTWPCSSRGLPLFTLTRFQADIVSVALSIGLRRAAVSGLLALGAPTFLSLTTAIAHALQFLMSLRSICASHASQLLGGLVSHSFFSELQLPPFRGLNTRVSGDMCVIYSS